MTQTPMATSDVICSKKCLPCFTTAHINHEEEFGWHLLACTSKSAQCFRVSVQHTIQINTVCSLEILKCFQRLTHIFANSFADIPCSWHIWSYPLRYNIWHEAGRCWDTVCGLLYMLDNQLISCSTADFMPFAVWSFSKVLRSNLPNDVSKYCHCPTTQLLPVNPSFHRFSWFSEGSDFISNGFRTSCGSGWLSKLAALTYFVAGRIHSNASPLLNLLMLLGGNFLELYLRKYTYSCTITN